MASLVHITPKDKPEYWIVTVAGMPTFCRWPIYDFEEALAYQRGLKARFGFR